jgi:hypothetical protein
MNRIRTRYPGAQPFSDDDFSHKVFFGREHEAAALTDQILATRMIVVYAKSGLGKTSLLNAGVAPRLRDEGYLPLIVRVNDVQRGPFAFILEGIQAEAERQQVEYVPGLSDSLWNFFKTAEFWRGDLLMTPVLILDQFEELFTLQGEEARALFLEELGYLVRGIRPPGGQQTDTPVSDSPPPIRLVLSLREDYLGLLEEAAGHMPQILDHRFRLAPLTLDAATEAMIGPAGIDDEALETRPFRFDPATITSILNYLSQCRAKSIALTTRYVEPFQLQLICSRIEKIVTQRQRQSPANLTVSLKDIGNEAGLSETLKDFYTEAIRTLPKRSTRRVVRRLCEEYLISPEGRRLSLEENEIRRQLGLSGETLRQLVNSRLLRADHRSDNTYYELSHDALVEPVLATGRKKALLFGWLGAGMAVIISPVLISLFFGVLIYATKYKLASNSVVRFGEVFVFAISILVVGTLAYVSTNIFLKSFGPLRRYRRRARSESELVDSTSAPRSALCVLSGWLGFIVGLFTLLIVILLEVYLLSILIYVYFLKSGGLEKSQMWQWVYKHGPGIDFIVSFIALPAVLLFAIKIICWSFRTLRLSGILRGTQL